MVRDDRVIRSTYRGPVFNSQLLHSGSLSSVTLGSGDPRLCTSFYRHKSKVFCLVSHSGDLIVC